MKVLVTGHKGFVGRHFLQHLSGYEVTGVDILDSKDARDFFRYNDTRYDLVIHLAAVVGGRRTIERFPLAVAVDLAIDAEMAGWALRTKPHQIIYFSSSAAYPVHLQDGQFAHKLSEGDIDLKNIKTPDLTYGWAKLSGEMLCDYLRESGLSVLVVRPFSGYAADQNLDYPFPSLIKRGHEKQNPFSVWGSLTTVRDWIHIDDVVDACLLFASHRLSVTVNLCTGVATSFETLVKLISEQCSYRPVIEALTDQPKGVSYRVGDPTLMRNLGYVPRISIEEGVSRALFVARQL